MTIKICASDASDDSMDVGGKCLKTIFSPLCFILLFERYGRDTISSDFFLYLLPAKMTRLPEGWSREKGSQRAKERDKK